MDEPAETDDVHGRLAAAEREVRIREAALATLRERLRDREQRLTHATVVLRDVAQLVERARCSRAWRYGWSVARAAQAVALRRPGQANALELAREEIDGFLRRSSAKADREEDEPSALTLARDDEEIRGFGETLRAGLGPPPNLDVPPTVSIVVPTRSRARARQVAQALDHATGYRSIELIVVETSGAGWRPTEGSMRVVRGGRSASFSEACNQGAAEASGELLLFLNDDVRPVEPGWLAELVVCQRRTEATIVGARLVTDAVAPACPSGWALQHRGIRFALGEDGLPHPYNAGGGEDALGDGHLGEDLEVAAVTGACLLTARGPFLQAGGFDPGYRYGLEDVDLCLTAVAAGGRIVCCNRAILIHAEGTTRRVRSGGERRGEGLANVQRFMERWAPRLRRELSLDPEARIGREPEKGVEAAIIDPGLGFVIKIGAPTWEVAQGGGDLGFARGLERALVRRGHRCVVQVTSEWDDVEGMAYDVAIHVRGRGSYVPKAGQLNVLWSISHPDELAAWECDAFDLVCVGSASLASTLALATDRMPIVLEQATDPEVFYPEPAASHRCDAVFVGHWRTGGRGLVGGLIQSGAPSGLAVWGRGWAERAARSVVRGEWLDAAELRRAYSSATVTLNDQWSDMREHGYIANRVFDAIACGSLVVSEHVPGLEERSAGGAICFHDAPELRRLLEYWSRRPEEARRRAMQAREQLLSRDTFDHRVRRLESELHRLREMRASPLA